MILTYIILGLTSGSAYALGGVGLVLTYKTSRIFNFGYGAIATTAAYLFYWLHDKQGMNWPLAALLSVVGVGVVLGFLFEPFARALAKATLAMQVAATVGVLIFVEALATVLYGNGTISFPTFLPTGTFKLFGAYVSDSQLITVIVALVATGALYAMFRFARTGVAMRGAVDNADLLDLAGTPPARIRRLAWFVGCTFTSAFGLLLAPGLALSGGTLTLLIVQAFGAAAIGAFSSLPMTYAGGLLIGVVASLVTKYTVSSPSAILQGIPPSTPFIVLFLVLLLMPRRWLTAPLRIVTTRPRWRAPMRLQTIAGIAVIVGLSFVPSIVGLQLTVWTNGLIYAVLFLSLGLLVRTSGQVSLSHLSFAAIGAAAFSHFTVGGTGYAGLGIPWVPALILAGLAAVPVGLLLAIPAIRLGGIFLALATFGFGLALQDMFYSSSKLMFGVYGSTAPRPSLSFLDVSSNTGYYYLVLGIVVACAVAVVVLNRTRLGRLLRAMADSPIALQTNGTNVTVTRLLVFSISAFLAGLAGALIGASNKLVDGTFFDPISSLVLITLILIVVGGEPWYALMAAAAYQIIPAYIPGGNVQYFLQMIFGASAVLVAIYGFPVVPAQVASAIDRRFARRRPQEKAHAAAGAGQPPAVRPGALEVRDIEVRFGGLVAVKGLSLSAATGQITGLIGPNGAGKTTTFNACSGLVRPSEGGVWLDDRDVTRFSASRRARLGLGRTFQQMELLDGLTVAENVELGGEASLAGANPLRQVVSRREEQRVVRRSVTHALELCGLGELGEERAGSLSTGQRRLVELARCLAGPYRILLLDEPSSGLDHHESEEFGRILQAVVAERGVGILLVEHDMSLVMRVCDHIHVLDFGVPIFEGAPEEVVASSAVQAAYLGEPDEALAERTE